MKRFDFDTVMFPLNRVHAAHFSGWNDWRPLLKTARQKDVGVFAIKVVAKRLWEGGDESNQNTIPGMNLLIRRRRLKNATGIRLARILPAR